MSQHPVIIPAGSVFGRWTTTGKEEMRRTTYNRMRFYECLCQCGERRFVMSRTLRDGDSRSCGCFQREIAREGVKNRFQTHGFSKERLYRIWINMRSRCYNKSDKCFRNWGGRGITVTPEWLTYEGFKEWALANGYSHNLSIDRIDNDGNYTPENCRWADGRTQCNNKRNNRRLSAFGETHTLTEWARLGKTPVTKHTLRERLQHGWTPEAALTLPLYPNRKKPFKEVH